MIVPEKQVVVVGLGKTGLSCVRYFKRLGRPVMVMDSRQNPPGLAELTQDFPDVEVVLGGFDRRLLCKAAEIILSPGVPLSNPNIQTAIASGVSVRGDIDLFVNAAKAPIVAITGSNGKSTVTTLVGEMALKAGVTAGVGGNLGTPALDLLADEQQLYVLELSSFQLETTQSVNATCAVILNISEDHMDRYPHKIDYLKAKQRIFKGAKNIVVNDDEVLSQPLLSKNVNLVHFGLSGPDQNKFSIMESYGQRYLSHGFTTLLPVKELAIKGLHNISNALAALAIGTVVGLRTEAMLAVLKEFRGLPHRCQFVRTVDGVDYIDDSKGTNAGAAATAIVSFGRAARGKVLLIAGGDSKGADLSPLAEPMAQFGKLAVLIGQDAKKLDEVLDPVVVTRKAKTLKEAVALARSQAAPGDIVLLSPACASFDMFDNYEHRGQVFVAEVEGL